MSELTTNTIIRDQEHIYSLVSYIGSGSYGEVWQAVEQERGIAVAIKFYIMLDEKGRREFFSEYETASVLEHTNLLTALHVGEWEGRPYLVMPYCSQGTSSKYVGVLTPSPENERLIWRFIHDVAAGLSYLHAVVPDPIVHQDIKPDNILINDDGDFVITDFGISVKIRSTMRSQSMRAAKAGAVAYMGPERFSDKPMLVMASDIWSLGASIYELAAGELPFCGMGGGMQNHGAELPNLGDGWSAELNYVVRKCLEKNTWDRFKAYELVEYAAAMLNQVAGTKTVGLGNAGKTVPVSVSPAVSASGNQTTGQDHEKKPKKKSGRWIAGLFVAAAIVGAIIVLGESPEHKYARTHKQDYIALVNDCRNKIDVGNNSDYADLLSAKDLLSDIKEYEADCSCYYPELYDEAGGLESFLNPKLLSASGAWAKAAESQMSIGNDGRALEYFKLAERLHSDEKYQSKIEKLSKAMGYMKIKGIKFGNTDADGNIITAAGETLTASEIKYLAPVIEYDGVDVTVRSVTLYVKIYRPNGTLVTGNSSPSGYSYSTDVTVYASTGLSVWLSGWGSSDGGVYNAGTHRCEVWYGGKKLYSQNVTLN